MCADEQVSSKHEPDYQGFENKLGTTLSVQNTLAYYHKFNIL